MKEDVKKKHFSPAYVLAKTGLLDGKSATTHHDAYKDFAHEFPKVRVVRGVRFVEEGTLATSGGLECGIDLFTGKERDAESGLDNFGARYNASSMGRFMSSDPLLNSGRPGSPQTWNRYSYARFLYRSTLFPKGESCDS